MISPNRNKNIYFEDYCPYLKDPLRMTNNYFGNTHFILLSQANVSF